MIRKTCAPTKRELQNTIKRVERVLLNSFECCELSDKVVKIVFKSLVYNLGSRVAWQVIVLEKHWEDRKLGSSFLSWVEGIRVYNSLRAKAL